VRYASWKLTPQKALQISGPQEVEPQVRKLEAYATKGIAAIKIRQSLPLRTLSSEKCQTLTINLTIAKV
jgi:hypothetical protein